MFKPIAIIGVSFELPKIDNWSDLLGSLHNGNTFVDHLSASRLEDFYNRFGKTEMSKGGHIKNIDLFDAEYFGISKREAIGMTPEQRYVLMHAVNAFYDAGYTESHLKATNTGVYYTAARSSYEFFLDRRVNDFNKVYGMEGTRVANFLDLRGPVISIDTSCSSSLVALHQACLAISHGECDKALIGGARFHSTFKQAALSSAVMSNDDDCKPFDEKANGLVNGEGVICMVVKSLEAAEKDNDPIYGVIRTSAVNHGGARIASLTAPNAEAQKEVLIAAWDKIDLDPAKIEFIEAHGTGTILGDPIEFEAIQKAYSEKMVKSKVATSSFKGQIGHLDSMSGLSGLLRLLAAVNSNIKPIQPNFSTINKFIDESKGVVKVQRATEKWSNNGTERIGGVNSFGLTGTNAHVVVSSYKQKNEKEAKSKVHFIQLGANSDERLQALKKGLIQHLNSEQNINLSLFSQKINRLYSSTIVSEGIIFSSKDELIEKLSQSKKTKSNNTAFFLLSLEAQEFGIENIQELFDENKLIKDVWNQLIGEPIFPESIKDKKVLNTLFQYVLYKYLDKTTESKIQIVTKKGAGSLRGLVSEEITPAELMNDPTIFHESEGVFNFDKFLDLLEQEYSNDEIVIVRFSKEQDEQLVRKGLTITEIKKFSAKTDRYRLYKTLLENNMKPLLARNSSYQFHELKVPLFSLKRYWPKAKLIQAAVKNDVATSPEKMDKNGFADIQAKVKNIWKDILELDAINDNDDFFELGGTSLSALDMTDEVEKNIAGVKIPYEEIYSYSSIYKMTQEILKQLSGGSNPIENDIAKKKLERIESRKIIHSIWCSILELEDINDEDDFFELGGTSLSALDMVDEIEQNIAGVKIPYEEIYAYSTITKLLNKIHAPNEVVSEEEEQLNPLLNSTLREENYGKLVARIKTENYIKEVPQNIFVTGGTGLVGLAVVDYLVNNTAANVYCLVRSKDHFSAEQIFWNTYEKHYTVLNRDRINVIEGDLYLPDLGIGKIDGSFSKMDSIFHIAGSPQFVSKKPINEHINFVGTKNVVNWANKHRIKKLNFVSTVGVGGRNMPPEVENFYETDTDLGQQAGNQIHYSSKLEAEKFINKFYDYKSKIFRISSLGGRYKDGIFPTDLNRNLMWQKLMALTELKFYCEEILELFSGIGFAPVDVIAKLISEISFYNVDALDVYHLFGSVSFTNGDILKTLTKSGYQLEATSYDNFLAYIGNNNSKMKFHEVTKNRNTHTDRDQATREIIARLNLEDLQRVDKYSYLEKLINSNLKINA